LTGLGPELLISIQSEKSPSWSASVFVLLAMNSLITTWLCTLAEPAQTITIAGQIQE
jgi:hypothetical protein